MAVTDELKPYEILIRFGEDGNPKGAHVQYRRVVTIDGEILKNEPLPAEAIDHVGFPTSAIMQQATVAALARISIIEAEAEKLAGDLGELTIQNDAKIIQVAALEEKVAQFEAARIAMMDEAEIAAQSAAAEIAQFKEALSEVTRSSEARVVELQEALAAAQKVSEPTA